MAETTERHDQEIPFGPVSIPGVVIIYAKGKGKGKPFLQPKNPLDNDTTLTEDQKINEFIRGIRQLTAVIGVENLSRAVYHDVIRPAANDASNAARGEDGRFSTSQYAEAFRAEFSRDRLKISEINDKIKDLQDKNMDLLLKAVTAHDQMSDAEKALALRVMLEIKSLNSQRNKKDASYDKRKATAAKTAEPVAA